MGEVRTIYRKGIWRRTWTVLLIFLALLFFGVPIIFWFHISTEGHNKLREAKNTLLALQITDVELYAQGESVYKGAEPTGINAKAIPILEKYVEDDAQITITSYDRTERLVTGMIYERGNFRVVFFLNQEQKRDWSVSYVFSFWHFEEES